MSDFEDRILRDRLQRLAGRLPDDDAAYAQLQQQVRAAKRRRAGVASAGLAALCLLALVTVNFSGRHHETVSTATDGVSVPDVSIPAETVPEATRPVASTTSSTAAVTTLPATTAPPTAATEASAPTVASTDAPPSTASTNTTTKSRGTAPTSPPAPTAPPAASVPETDSQNPAPGDSSVPSADETRTFTAAHGSITVRLHDGHLTLAGHQADDGFTFRLDRAEPDRIRVRFRSDVATSQIDVSIVEGHLVGTVEEQASGPSGATAPTVPGTDDSTRGGPGHN
jgi:hypothetical protein